MLVQSNHDRAYLMALGAWKSFGYTSESPETLARRIAAVGDAKGLSAAAEAIAEDCRQHGLQMSASRVLKSLSDSLERYRTLLSQIDAIEELTVEAMGRTDEQKRAWIDAIDRGGAKPKRSRLPTYIIYAVVIFGILWLVLRSCSL